MILVRNESGHPVAPRWTAILLFTLALVLLAALPTSAAEDAAADPAATPVPWVLIDQPGSYTLDHDLSVDSPIGVLITSSDIVLDGMGHRIEGIDATASTGVVVGGISPEPSIVNVTVRNLTVCHWHTGIEVMRANGSVIEHVIAEQNGAGLSHGGPEFFPSENGVVRDSVFRNNTWVGIALGYPFGGIAIERCRVTGNGRGMDVASGPGTYDTYRGSPSLVADCDISGNEGHGLEIREDGYSFRQGVVSAVRNCTIRGNGGDGVMVERSTTTIIENRVEENGGYGVNTGDNGGSNITSNWIADNRYGVSAGGDWPSHVRNNYLNNTENGDFGSAPASWYLNFTKTAGTNIVGGPYIGGNFWADPSGSGFSQTHPDADRDGICDEPFVMEDATDYLPLAPWIGPGPTVKEVPGGVDVPTDTNGDGKYDDVNGNQATDFNDLVLYFYQLDWIIANEPLSAFDYNGNGGIDFADIIWLFDYMGTGPTVHTVMAAAVGPGEIAPAGNITVREGENITFSLINRGTLPTPYDTQSGYVVRNEVRVDPSVVPTPYPFPISGGSWSFTPSFTLADVRANHTVYGVFSYVPVTC